MNLHAQAKTITSLVKKATFFAKIIINERFLINLKRGVLNWNIVAIRFKYLKLICQSTSGSVLMKTPGRGPGRGGGGRGGVTLAPLATYGLNTLLIV